MIDIIYRPNMTKTYIRMCKRATFSVKNTRTVQDPREISVVLEL